MILPRLSIAAWLLLTPFLCWLYLTVLPSPDQELFDYIAWSRLQGGIYYADVAEQNWPGKMFMHELGLRIFGTHFWTFRAIDFAALQLFTGAGMLFLARAGFRTAPWVFLLLYPPLYVTAGAWMAGQRDIVATGLLVAAAAMTLPASGEHRRDRSRACVLAGAFAFMAIITRPTYLTFLAFLMLVELVLLLARKQRIERAIARVALMVIGFAVPLAGILWLGQQAGALDDFYQQTILFNIQSYQVEQSRLTLFKPLFFLIGNSWHWIAAVAAIGALLWARSGRNMQALALILGIAGTILLSYFVQNKGFGYHLGGLLLLFCLLIGVAFDTIATGRRKATTSRAHFLITGVLIGVTALVMAGTGKKIAGTLPPDFLAASFRLIPNDDSMQRGMRWEEKAQIIELLKDKTSPQDYVLQWGRNFSIPFLAERRSPIRFVSIPALYVISPAFSNHDDWLAEVTQDLDTKRPAAIIVENKLLPPRQAGRFVSTPGAPLIDSILSRLLNSYDPVITNTHVTVFLDPGS